MKQKLQKLIDILINGSPEEYRNSKKAIEKMFHTDTENFQKNAVIILDYLPKFESTKLNKNKAAFASGLQRFYLVLADDYFEVLKNFTLHVIQHPDGSIREAIRKTSDWLYVSLTSRMDGLRERRNIALIQYKDYLKEIESLIDKNYDKKNDHTAYIDDMKPSVQKSLELLRVSLIRGHILESMHVAPPEILAKRDEIELELTQILEQINSEVSFDYIREIIFHEQEHDDFKNLIMLFDIGQGMEELNTILETISDAWNYFPHQNLNGLSPAEMVQNSKL